jgi:hypothetical protein
LADFEGNQPDSLLQMNLEVEEKQAEVVDYIVANLIFPLPSQETKFKFYTQQQIPYTHLL